MSLGTRRPPTPFDRENLPELMICAQCERRLPVGRFVRVVDGAATVLMRCDECQAAAPAREDAARLALRVERDRIEAMRDLVKRLDVHDHDAPITQELWKLVVLEFGGLEQIAKCIKRNLTDLESESQRVRATEVLLKLSNASTNFEQNRVALAQVSDDEIDQAMLEMARSGSIEVRRKLIEQLQDSIEADEAIEGEAELLSLEDARHGELAGD